MKRKPDDTDKKTEYQPDSAKAKITGTIPASSSSSPLSPCEVSTSTDPEYGSQEYWEKRYTKNKKLTNSKCCGAHLSKSDENEKKSDDRNDDGGDDASLGHEWYFTFEELKSLILPLILGGRGEEFDQWSDDEDEGNGDGDEDEGDMWEEVEGNDEEEEKKLSSTSAQEEVVDVGDENGEEGECAVNGDEEVSNDYGVNEYYEIYKAIANEKNMPPKKVLEVGCGDVPLGHDLCQELLHFQGATGVNAKLAVEKIICFDYSKNVIDLLVNQQHGEKGSNGKDVHKDDTLAVQFEVLDARNLPFKESHFDLIMDKGTLDAMLSDKKEGTQNCVKIISEASRLLANGGYLLIVSHLNACNAEGLSWVEKVLLTGLRNGDKISDWRIEVHSGDENDVSGGDDAAADDDGEKDLGPAVYIIQKVAVPDDKAKMRESCQGTSKASIKFFGY